MHADYDRLRLLWPDHLGLARGKYLPKERAERGTAHCISLFTLGFDRDMTPHPGGMMMEGLPDVDAVYDPDQVRPGWEERTAVAIPRLVRHGAPVMMAPRNVLIEAIEAEGRQFCVGVQWHPEKLVGIHRDGLFGAFVTACR